MMTTDRGNAPGSSGTSVLLGAGAVTLVATALTAGAGLLMDDPAAARGALVGGLVALAVMSFGTLSLNLVAGVMPGASLALALLTYGLQVALTATVLIALTQSGLLGSTLDREWLGGTLIGAVVIWTAAHVRAASRVRILIYDLPERIEPTAAEADAR